MRIVIIGGGIGGLAAYHALRKNLPSSIIIDIYEAHPSALTTTGLIGGGLFFAPNGQRALSAILPSALSYIHTRGHSHPKVIFRNNAGGMICQIPFGSKERYGFETISCPRAVIHEALLLEDDMDKKVRWNSRVKSVFETLDSVKVEFENGTVETCDLLIGSDGAHSVCRNALYGDEYLSKYDGMTAVCGFIPISSLSPSIQESIQKEPRVMTMGQHGAFGLFKSSHPSDSIQRVLWNCFFEINPPPSRTTPPIEFLDPLLARYGDWKSPYDPSPSTGLIREVLIKACEDGNNKWLILPRWFTPILPHWTSLHGLSATGSDGVATGSGRVILLGDSAHAMPSDGAQGVSCAVEDALALSLILKRHSKFTPDDFREVARAYEDIRKPRVDKILAAAKERADRKREVSYLTLKIRETAMYLMNWFPESFLHDEDFGHDVEAQVAKYFA